MPTKKRTSILVDKARPKRSRKALRPSNKSREIDATLSTLLRKGRGRFVDVYR